MRGKERHQLYNEGQAVQFNIGSLVSPEWVEGEVLDTSPETKETKGVMKVVNRLLGLEPMSVRIDEEAEAFAGAEFIVYKSGSKVRPKSLNPDTE